MRNFAITCLLGLASSSSLDVQSAMTPASEDSLDLGIFDLAQTETDTEFFNSDLFIKCALVICPHKFPTENAGDCYKACSECKRGWIPYRRDVREYCHDDANYGIHGGTDPHWWMNLSWKSFDHCTGMYFHMGWEWHLGPSYC